MVLGARGTAPHQFIRRARLVIIISCQTSILATARQKRDLSRCADFPNPRSRRVTRRMRAAVTARRALAEVSLGSSRAFSRKLIRSTVEPRRKSKYSRGIDDMNANPKAEIETTLNRGQFYKADQLAARFYLPNNSVTDPIRITLPAFPARMPDDVPGLLTTARPDSTTAKWKKRSCKTFSPATRRSRG